MTGPDPHRQPLRTLLRLALGAGVLLGGGGVLVFVIALIGVAVQGMIAIQIEPTPAVVTEPVLELTGQVVGHRPTLRMGGAAVSLAGARFSARAPLVPGRNVVTLELTAYAKPDHQEPQTTRREVAIRYIDPAGRSRELSWAQVKGTLELSCLWSELRIPKTRHSADCQGQASQLGGPVFVDDQRASTAEGDYTCWKGARRQIEVEVAVTQGELSVSAQEPDEALRTGVARPGQPARLTGSAECSGGTLPLVQLAPLGGPAAGVTVKLKVWSGFGGDR